MSVMYEICRVSIRRTWGVPTHSHPMPLDIGGLAASGWFNKLHSEIEFTFSLDRKHWFYLFDRHVMIKVWIVSFFIMNGCAGPRRSCSPVCAVRAAGHVLRLALSCVRLAGHCFCELGKSVMKGSYIRLLSALVNTEP